MATNLCTSFCPKCGYWVRLGDLRGKPIEFRRTGEYAPELGCRFDCPCGEVYFAIWRRRDTFWGPDLMRDADRDELGFKTGQRIQNEHKGKFYIQRKDWREETGTFTIDLSYYCTYRDEDLTEEDGEERERILSGQLDPRRLCKDNAHHTELVWGHGSPAVLLAGMKEEEK